MQTINKKNIMTYKKISSVSLVFVASILMLVSCQKDPVQINPLATLNIELTKKYSADGIVCKSQVTEFDAAVSVAYEDDTIVYNSKFVAADNATDLYMYDHANSDVLYAAQGKPFRVLVDAIIGGAAFHGESEIFVLDNEPLTTSIDLVSLFNYVDLGLPSGLKWANCNLGASSPEKQGKYYAWGEIAEKQAYNWETYEFYKDSMLVKYTDSDGLTSLETDNDAATSMLGSAWRMPTREEFAELYDNCNKEYTTQNEVNGYRFTGPNGNSIFLPLAGGRDGEGLMSNGESGFYWVSTLYSDDIEYAWGFILEPASCYETSYYRMLGQTIRPVYNE